MGHLSRSLWEQLRSVDAKDLPGLRWGEIWRQVEAAVLERNPRQRPWLSAGFGRAVFGGDPDDRGDAGFAIRRHGDAYELNAGTLAGVTEGARIAVYGPEPAVFPPLGSAVDRTARVGELRIASAGRAGSTGVPIGSLILPNAARGRLAAPGADTTLTVFLQPHDDEITGALRESPFLRLTDDPRQADLELHRRDEGWFLADDLYGPGPGSPCLPSVPHGRPDILRTVVEHYYRYRAPLRLAHACRDLPTLLRISLLDCNRRSLAAEDAQTAALPEVTGTGQARYAVRPGDRLCITVHNHSEDNLYVTVVDSAATGRVELLGAGQVPACGRERFWAGNELGDPFAASLPEGQPVGVDRLIAIGTTVPGLDLGHLRLDTGFADLVRLGRDSAPRRDLLPDTAPPLVERYASATADLWTGTRGPSWT
jgi:hypothetical protein